MKSPLVLLFFLMALNLVAVAQSNENMNKPLDVIIASVNSNNPKYNAVEGSPYLNEEFLPVKIVNVHNTRLVRLNAVDNTIEIKTDGNEVGTLNQSEKYIISFLDGSEKKYEIHLYTNEYGTIKTTFFEVVHSDE